MIYLVLRASNRTKSMIKNFERFLEAYNLKMLKYWDGKGTYELAVSTSNPNEIKWVNNLAIDFFNDELISLRSELSKAHEIGEKVVQQSPKRDSGQNAKVPGD